MDKSVTAKIQKIKRIARDVYRSMGSGFSEFVYDKAMQVGLRLAGFRYESQKVVELKYKNHYVGEGYPDLVVDLGREKIIIEIKSVGSALGPAEEQQLKNYLRHLRIKTGLLINFQQPERRAQQSKLEIKEVILQNYG